MENILLNDKLENIPKKRVFVVRVCEGEGGGVGLWEEKDKRYYCNSVCQNSRECG